MRGEPESVWCANGTAGCDGYLPTERLIRTGQAKARIICSACGTITTAAPASGYYLGGVKDNWVQQSKNDLKVRYLEQAVVRGLAGQAFGTPSESELNAIAVWNHFDMRSLLVSNFKALFGCPDQQLWADWLCVQLASDPLSVAGARRVHGARRWGSRYPAGCCISGCRSPGQRCPHRGHRAQQGIENVRDVESLSDTQVPWG